MKNVPGNNVGLSIYLVFMTSWFLHIGTRIPAVGVIRIDFVLVCLLAVIAIAQYKHAASSPSAIGGWLRALLIYAVITIPFVEWPGSVLRAGIQEVSKAVVFYYFTVSFVRNTADLRKFLAVFIGCQLFRILEPLYLHITEGYWGSTASMDNWEYLNRLSGAPSDVVNPNGLAFIICTVIPFLYFLAGRSFIARVAAVSVIGICVYTLLLTGSRSGLVGLGVVLVGIVLKSGKPLLVAMIGAVAIAVVFPLLDGDMQDRYLSIVGMGPKNEVTAEGRLDGVINNFDVALQRPIFGHGLGTSREANANYGATDQPAHNLYAEVAQELGFVGLLIFLGFMKSIESGYRSCLRSLRSANRDDWLVRVTNAGQVWFWMCFAFSFASYGLSGYEWYLNAGLVVVILSLALRPAETPAVPEIAKGVARRRLSPG